MNKVIYRIEHPETMDGMWYDRNGAAKKRIHILCPNGIAKDFPMPLNLNLHRKDNKIWYSGGKSIENMNQWFTADDAINLQKNGFKLFKFEVNNYQELEMEMLFCREDIIKQIEISLDEVWDI